MKKRILSLLLSLIMVLSLLPTTAWATGWGGHGGGSYPGSTLTHVNHIDINTKLQANVTIDGTTYTQDVSFSWNDTQNGNLTITATQGGESVTVPNYTNGGNGGSWDSPQVRLSAQFPIGTQSNPVVYTLTLEKTLTINSVSVPVTLVVQVDYWSTLNICPGKNMNANQGIDVGVFETNSNTGSLSIQKTVAGVALTEAKTFNFTVSGNGETRTLQVTIPAGSTTAITTTMLPYGTYTVTEDATSAGIGGYTLTAPSAQSVTLSVQNNTPTVNFTNTYAQEVVNGNLTIKKVVAGDVTDNTKAYSFTVTNSSDTQVGSFTLKNGEDYTINDLAPGTYTVTESGADIIGYTLSTTGTGSATVTAGQTTEVTVTNNYTQKTTNITVEKVWNNTDSNFTAPKADSVTVTLYADNEATSETLTLSESNNWTDTFNDLPTHKNGNEIAYTVKETAVDGYTGTVTGSAANGYIITNTPNWFAGETKATLTVIKVDSTDSNKKLAGATFTLYNADKTEVVGSAQTTTSSGTITFENLTTGTYTLEETTAPAGYTAAADETITIGVDKTEVREVKDSSDNVIGYEKHTVYKNESVTVSNTMKVGDDVTVPAKVIITKVDSADSNKKLTGATFTLTSPSGTVLTSTVRDNGVYEITNINEAGDWTLSETVAPTGYDGGYTATITVASDGGKFALDKVKDKYYTTTTYTIRGNTEYTLTAPNTRSTTSVSVKKVWTGDEENQELRPTSITVNLMNGEIVADTKELTAEKDWKDTFEDVRKYDDNNVPIDYTVVEAPVANYKAGVVTPDNNGGFTITNELAPTEYTATVDIEKIVKKTGGNVAPGEEEFVFVAYYKGTEKNMAVGEARITTDGEGTYTNKMVLTVPASAFDLDNNGDGTVTLYVSEISGASAGWTYDPTVYKLVMTVKNYAFAGISSGDEIEFTPIIGSVPDGQGSDGASDTITLSFTNEFSQTKTPNRPHKPGKPITSVKTGDAGVAMYAMSGLLSLGGAALFMKKRKDEE